MDRCMFKNWFEKTINLLPENNVFIIDNAPYTTWSLNVFPIILGKNVKLFRGHLTTELVLILIA